MPRRPDRVAHAVLDGQLLGGFPAILHEPIERVATHGVIGFAAELGIIVEIAEQRVGHGQSGGQRVARVQEAEGSVLIDGGRGAGGGELDVIVLAGALDEDAEFDGVVADDLGRVVRPRIDEARPGPGIGAVVDRGQAVDGDRRQLVAVPLGAGKNERVIEAGGAAAASRAAGRIGIDRAQPVGVRREGELVDEGRRKAC